jgi:tight adherence protein C
LGINWNIGDKKDRYGGRVMDISTIFLALPIFFIGYQGVGLLMDAQAAKKWSTGSAAKGQTLGKAVRDFTQLSAKLGFNKILLRNKSLRERLELLLLRSGNPFGWKEEDFLFIKEIVALVVFGLLWWLKVEPVILWPVAALLGFLLPDMYMKAKVTTRQADVQRKLPGFVDLVALALESGLDLMAAIERILEKMRASPLREELQTLLQETRLGTPRKEALDHLAFRVNLADIQSMVSIINQSEELGTGLATVLRNYAEDMRSRRILRAEENAGKAPVKLLFPMMVFFFPIVFVVIFGPLALSFMSQAK